MHCLECGELTDGGYCRDCGIQWDDDSLYEDEFLYE